MGGDIMDKILVKGTQNFLGKEIPVITGGFSEGQKVVLAKTIAEIHGVELREVNQLINNNIDEFDFGIDILDLKNTKYFNIITNDLEIKVSNNTKNFYLLSEQGYHALVSIMKTEKAKAIRKQLRREYFAMREIINSNEQLKAMALLKATEGKTVEERLNGIVTYAELKVEEETQPLLEKIDDLEPLADRYNIYLDTDGLTDISSFSKSLGIKKLGRNNLYKWMRENKYLDKDNKPYQKYIEQELFLLKPNGSHKVKNEVIPDFKVFLTKKGVDKFINKFIKIGLLKK